VRNAVNLPNLDAKTYAQVKPYLSLGEKLGRLLGQLAPKQVDHLFITYGGKAREIITDPVTRSILRGFLEFSAGKDINYVNVRTAATSRGILVEEKISDEPVTFNEWLHVSVYSGKEKKVSAGGTFFGSPNNPRIVRLFSMPVEIVPSGVVFLMNNKDRPGMVGHIGTLMGKYHVNIASMSLGRDQAGGQALTVLNLDNLPPAEVLDEIRKDPDISNVRVVKL
jgi:D-3-phosphoglycerate dehydrogenase